MGVILEDYSNQMIVLNLNESWQCLSAIKTTTNNILLTIYNLLLKVCYNV